MEEEDLEMSIGPWVSSRSLLLAARLDVEIAKCNSRMICRSQHIVDVD